MSLHWVETSRMEARPSILALTYFCAAEIRVSTAALSYEGCFGFRCKPVSTIITWVIPEGKTSTANDTNDTSRSFERHWSRFH
jgi:hypothetical protein